MTTEEKNSLRQTFRKMPLKEKISYIFYYYKWHMIIAAALLIFITSITYGIMTTKKVVFDAVMINSNVTAPDSPPIMEDFAKKQNNWDPQKECMTIDYIDLDVEMQDQATLATEQKILAMIAAEDMDCMIAPKNVIDKYASAGAFTDLRELISEEKLNEIEQAGYKLYYIDRKNEEDNSITRVLAGIDISDASVIKSGFSTNSGQIRPYYDNNPSSVPIYSVIINSTNKNRAVDFFSYLTAR